MGNNRIYCGNSGFNDEVTMKNFFPPTHPTFNRLYDIDQMIKFIDSGKLSDNDLGGDIAKPVLISIAKQLNDLHKELLDITGEEDFLNKKYPY